MNPWEQDYLQVPQAGATGSPDNEGGGAMPWEMEYVAPQVATSETTESAESPATSSRFDNILGGINSAIGGATFEMADELGAAAGVPLTYLQGDYDGMSVAERYREMKNRINAPRERFASANPKTELATNVLGSLATGGHGAAKTMTGAVPATLAEKSVAAVTGQGAPSGFMPAVGRSAAEGSAYGFGASDDMGGAKGDMLTGGAMGVGFGLGVPAVQKGLGFVLNPTLNPKVAALVSEGIEPTPGGVLGGRAKAFEDKATSIPLIGDIIASGQNKVTDEFNTAAINRVVDPISDLIPPSKRGEGDIGYEAVEAAQEGVSAAYDDVLSTLSVRADDQMIEELANLDAITVGLQGSDKKRLDDIVSQVVLDKFTPEGTMHPKTMKEVDSQIGQMSSDMLKSKDFTDQQMGRALGEVKRILRENLARTNPAKAADLRRVDDAYGNLLTVENAAARTGAKGGRFTPAGLGQASRATDNSLRKRKTAHGRARMQDLATNAEDVIGSKVNDSGTAPRMLLAGAAGTGLGLVNPALLGLTGAMYGVYNTPAGRAGFRKLVSERPTSMRRLDELLQEMGLNPSMIDAYRRAGVTAGGNIGVGE